MQANFKQFVIMAWLLLTGKKGLNILQHYGWHSEQLPPVDLPIHLMHLASGVEMTVIWNGKDLKVSADVAMPLDGYAYFVDKLGNVQFVYDETRWAWAGIPD